MYFHCYIVHLILVLKCEFYHHWLQSFHFFPLKASFYLIVSFMRMFIERCLVLKELATEIEEPAVETFNNFGRLENRRIENSQYESLGERWKGEAREPVVSQFYNCYWHDVTDKDQRGNKLVVIKSSQHGFMKSKSCLTNWLKFFEDRIGKVAWGEPVYRLSLRYLTRCSLGSWCIS